MKKLILLFVVVIIAINVQGQEYKKFWGATADTLNADDSIEKVFNVRESKNMEVSVQVTADEISGTAGGTAILYESIDGESYISTGQSVTWSTGDTTFILTDNTFVGAYAKIGIVANSTTQNQRVYGALKSAER